MAMGISFEIWHLEALSSVDNDETMEDVPRIVVLLYQLAVIRLGLRIVSMHWKVDRSQGE
jgi:hypothetical protein